MLSVVIVDDEKQCCETLKQMLAAYCPQVNIVAECYNIKDAEKAAGRFRPDIVFLDVEMPGGTGFDFLAGLPDITFEVIFTTAHDEYALKAIKYSALDFLLKPISRQELEEAIKKATLKTTAQQRKIDTLLYNINLLNKDKKIALPTFNGLEFVSVAEIIRCQADNNYTIFYLQNNRKIMVSKTLREYEDMLGPEHFFRVHQSHLINLRDVKSYNKNDGWIITMSDNSTVDVSRRKRDEFIKRISML